MSSPKATAPQKNTAQQTNSAQNPRPVRIDTDDDAAIRRFFDLDPSSGVPPYAQIRRRVIAARNTGELESGSRLPPVRRLATVLNLANNTVAKAYKELEAAAVVETKGRSGSFLRPASSLEDKAVRLTKRYLADLRGLGLHRCEAEALLRRIADESDQED